ncbi:polysaccharide biosynthesis protein [Bacillus sp. 2205SS5-2]|uniref:polysaccharide biosynthesis protein n=1 Tax=Bacillus sp. 2205SS5-2 TaxID=3109031 RepID=UPI0030055CB3
MSKTNRLWSLVAIDTLIIFISIYLSTLLLFPNSPIFTLSLFILSGLLVLSHLILATFYKLYKRAWEYASLDEILIIIKSVSLSIIFVMGFQWLVSDDVYFRVLISTWMLQVILISASRVSWRLVMKEVKHQNTTRKKRTLIIGAGSAGTLVARQLRQSQECELYPVAFIDDDKRKQHLDIQCIPVVGGMNVLKEKVDQLNIENIVIAIPSLNKKQLNEIYTMCQQTNKTTQMLPMFEDLVTGKIAVNEIKEVDVSDLLGREPIELDTYSIQKYISGGVVVITGAGGSIGSEICRQISAFHPAQLVLLGRGENSIYSIEMELRALQSKGINIVTEIADVRDRDKMFTIMKKYKPTAVFHAAAHKHVPLMERNPDEAVSNNIFGTKNVAEAADAAEVEIFVMISTDKAVNPTSVMGASKRIAEMIVQNLDQHSVTRFVAVRFGNVLGSRGSVIPLFKKQIMKGGPVTVTHPDMERFFMTIPEASRLVLQAAALAKGGEIFVLDMGEPVRIVDLAKNLIKLSGLTEEEVGITYTGMRPGEKLYEELLNDGEEETQQVHPKIYVGKSLDINTYAVLEQIKNFEEMDENSLRRSLLEIAKNPEQLIPKTVVS